MGGLGFADELDARRLISSLNAVACNSVGPHFTRRVYGKKRRSIEKGQSLLLFLRGNEHVKRAYLA